MRNIAFCQANTYFCRKIAANMYILKKQTETGQSTNGKSLREMLNELIRENEVAVSSIASSYPVSAANGENCAALSDCGIRGWLEDTW